MFSWIQSKKWIFISYWSRNWPGSVIITFGSDYDANLTPHCLHPRRWLRWNRVQIQNSGAGWGWGWSWLGKHHIFLRPPLFPAIWHNVLFCIEMVINEYDKSSVLPRNLSLIENYMPMTSHDSPWLLRFGCACVCMYACLLLLFARPINICA